MIVFDAIDSSVVTGASKRGRAWRSRFAARPVRERGIAIIAVLLLVVVTLAIGLLSATSSRTEMAIAHNQVLELRALGAAEAGISMLKKQIERTYAAVNNELALNTGCTCTTATCNYGVGTSASGLEALGSLANMTLPDDSFQRCYRFAPFGGAASDGYYVRVEDNLDEPVAASDLPLADADQAIRVISHGVIGTSVRTVVAMFNLTPGLPSGMGLFAKTELNFSGATGGTVIADTYTGTPPSLVYSGGASIGSNAVVDLGNGVVNGDITSGGNSSSVDYNPSYPPTGDVTTGAPLVTYDPVAACGPPFSGTSGITFTGDGTYNTSTGKLTCGGACSNVTLAPGTYCFGEVVIGTTMTVTGPTVINTTNKFTVSGGAIANTTGDASQLQLNSSLVGNQAYTISGTSGIFAMIYAPLGNIVISGGGDLYGGAIVNKATFSGESSFHQYGSAGGTPGVVSVTSWHEVQH